MRLLKKLGFTDLEIKEYEQNKRRLSMMTNAVLEAMELVGKFTADAERFEVVKREVFLYPEDNGNWSIPKNKVLRITLEFINPEDVHESNS